MKRILIFLLKIQLKSFISHTVQMKRKIYRRKVTFKDDFISHTVQMKPEITTPNII